MIPVSANITPVFDRVDEYLKATVKLCYALDAGVDAMKILHVLKYVGEESV